MTAELGAWEKRYPVDNGRRGRIAIVCLLLGVVVTPLSLLLAGQAYDTQAPGDDFVPSLLAGVGIGLLGVGCGVGWLFRARAGEAFDLHAGGLVHSYKNHRRAVRWSDITEVTDLGKDTALARLLGADVTVQLKLAQGRPITITALTAEATDLVAAVRRGVDQA